MLEQCVQWFVLGMSGFGLVCVSFAILASGRDWLKSCRFLGVAMLIVGFIVFLLGAILILWHITPPELQPPTMILCASVSFGILGARLVNELPTDWLGRVAIAISFVLSIIGGFSYLYSPGISIYVQSIMAGIMAMVAASLIVAVIVLARRSKP